MKQFFSCLLLLGIFYHAQSGTPDGYRDSFRSSGSISATINGQQFQVREGDFYRAILVNKAASFTNASTGKQIVTSLYFYGTDSVDAQSNSFTEHINIDYTFNPSEIGEMNNVQIDVNYQLGEYYMLPEKNEFRVTKMEWNADRTGFVLSGRFECILKKRGYSSDWQHEVRMKGEVTDVKVSVPPWIASKLNTEASLGQ